MYMERILLLSSSFYLLNSINYFIIRQKYIQGQTRQDLLPGLKLVYDYPSFLRYFLLRYSFIARMTSASGTLCLRAASAAESYSGLTLRTPQPSAILISTGP